MPKSFFFLFFFFFFYALHHKSKFHFGEQRDVTHSGARHVLREWASCPEQADLIRVDPYLWAVLISTQQQHSKLGCKRSTNAVFGFLFFKRRRWILTKTYLRTQARKHTPHLYSAAKQSWKKTLLSRCNYTSECASNGGRRGGAELPCLHSENRHFHHARMISRKVRQHLSKCAQQLGITRLCCRLLYTVRAIFEIPLSGFTLACSPRVHRWNEWFGDSQVFKHTLKSIKTYAKKKKEKKQRWLVNEGCTGEV